VALQEPDETNCRLELLGDSQIIPRPKLKELRAEISELIAIFVTSVKTVKRRNKG